jgi:hypothetical protein
LVQVIVVPAATVMSESAKPTILDANTAGGGGVGAGVGGGVGVAVDAGGGVAVGSTGAGVAAGAGGGPAGVGVGFAGAVDVACGAGGGVGAGVGVADTGASGTGTIVSGTPVVGAAPGSAVGSSSDVVGASPAAVPGARLRSRASEGVAIAVAAAPAAGGLVGTDAAGVSDATSSVSLGPEPVSELHAAAANTIKDNAVTNAARPGRILRRIATSLIVTEIPYS